MVEDDLRRDRLENQEPPPLPKRLRSKTQAAGMYDALDQGATLVLPTADKANESLPDWKLTKKARSLFAAEKARRRKKESKSYKDTYEEAYRQWSELAPTMKHKYIDLVVTAERSDSSPKAPIAYTNNQPISKEAENSLAYSCGLLLTWNGPWFLDDAAYVELVREWYPIQHVLVKRICMYPGIQELFDEFRTMILVTEEKLKLREWSGCLELSLEA